MAWIGRVHRLESGSQGPPLWGSPSSKNALHLSTTVLHPPAKSSASPATTFHTSVLRVLALPKNAPSLEGAGDRLPSPFNSQVSLVWSELPSFVHRISVAGGRSHVPRGGTLADKVC